MLHTKIQFIKIFDNANTMPIIHYPIVEQKQYVKGNYFTILVSIACIEDSINNDQLFFLQRMILADRERSKLEQFVDYTNRIDVKGYYS